MLISVDVTEKSFGDKVLYTGLKFDVQPGEKIGLIGRNGTGKSTLFNLITEDDTDYQGEIIAKRGTVIISSRQEHHGHEDKVVLEYIQGDLPEYVELSHIIDTYPETMGDDTRKIQKYSEALDRFVQLGYYQTEDQISHAFDDYQLDQKLLHAKLDDLSGGQKRMIELIKVQRSRGDLALIDEPTNHMDLPSIEWLEKYLLHYQGSVVIVSHDKYFLNRMVTKIVEVV